MSPFGLFRRAGKRDSPLLIRFAERGKTIEAEHRRNTSGKKALFFRDLPVLRLPEQTHL